jgi:hypothetical protein
MNEPVNDNPNDWPIHALTADKEAEHMASIKQAQEWQRQEAEAAAKACRYLTQAAQGITPHD